ncbi:MAG TPA: helix-turn-helix transcriptional regulator [Feifaniaceae bacterium]|nr:helix-turn-helix transcriptional regulator [Feifaniaceae bacterium]
MGQNLIADMDIKDNVKRLREKSGMSQAVVAAKLQTMDIKMSRSWFSAIELGKRNVPVRVLVGLKIIFKCSYEDFFAGLDEALLNDIS